MSTFEFDELAALNQITRNLREPDGTLRLVISDKSKAPEIFVKGREYPHPDRKTGHPGYAASEQSCRRGHPQGTSSLQMKRDGI